MATAKELLEAAKAARPVDHDRYEALMEAARNANPSPEWAHARLERAEIHFGCSELAAGLALVEPVRAAPVEIVGAEARAIARALLISASDLRDQPASDDEIAATAAECEEAGAPYYAAGQHRRLAAHARQAGDLDTAIRRYQRAFELYEQAGSRGAPATRVDLARILHQRGDDDGALVELLAVGAALGRRLVGSWQLIYNDMIALRADILAAAALREHSRAAAVAHYQHAFELSGFVRDRPRRDQQALLDHKARVELDPGNVPMVVTLDDLLPLTVAFSTRAWDAILALATGILSNPVALSHPRAWLVASLARELANDELGRDVDLDVLAASAWQLDRLDTEHKPLATLGREVLARRLGYAWFS